MNKKLNDSDFFPTVHERDNHLAAPEVYLARVETDEDRQHEEYLERLAVEIDETHIEENGKIIEWGELPYNLKADKARWDELEKDFDRTFELVKRFND